jgi:uncharacterized membrane protein
MTYQRPVLSIPPSNQEKQLNLIAIVGLVALFVVAAYGTFVLPDTIPVHFGIDGRANGWGGKNILWVLPGLALFLYGFLTFVGGYPHTFNYIVNITQENAQRQYKIALSTLNWLKTELVWIFAFLEWQMYSLAISNNSSLGVWILPLVLIVLFGTVGFWLRQSFLAR